MKSLFYLTIFIFLTSFDFQNFNTENLENESMLYNSAKLAKNYSGKKTQWQHPYGLPQPEQICAKTSVWLDFYPRALITDDNKTVLETLGNPKLWDILEDIGIQGVHTNPMKLAGGIVTGKLTPSVDGGYDRISINIDPEFGTQEQYIEMTKVIHSYKAVVIGDLIPGHTGLGSDFVLACMNYKGYPGIYTMVEIDKNDWSLLPQVKENEFSKNLNFKQVDSLKNKGYIVGRLERVIFAEPGVKISNWDATKEITGIDGKKRRWVYLHVFKAGQPSLNWLDPTYGADRLIAGDVMQSLGVLNMDGLRLDANGFLGVEKRPGKQKAWSEGEPLSVVSSNLISMLVRKLGTFTRKLGGFTFQELNLTMTDMKKMLEYGADFSYDFITRTAYLHALITGDTAFLKLNISLMNEAKLSAIRFIHALQNHDELTYELVNLNEHANEEFFYKNKKFTGRQIRQQIRKEDFSKILTQKTPYILGSGNGPCTTMVGLCAAALGVKDIFSMTQKQKDEVKKAHLLLTFFNAMQPGIFMVSGWDLVGAYPLKPEQVKDLIKDGDNRWINRGAYDLLGSNPNKQTSPSDLPVAQTLYGPLPQQLQDSSSYVSNLKKMLKIRKVHKINLSQMIDLVKVKNTSLYVMVYKLYDNSVLMTALNFSKDPIQEKIDTPHIKNKKAVNIITDNKEEKKYFSSSINLQLEGFEGKAIRFY